MTEVALPFVESEDTHIPNLIADRIHLKEGEIPSLFISENDRNNVQIQAFVRKITDKNKETVLRFLPLNEIHALNKGDKLQTDLQLTSS
ncbi:hypothetical protein VBY78_003986, partial [Enterobacter bugandensis]|nr:hypothetical protein [Enterobacter bugandensis]